MGLDMLSLSPSTPADTATSSTPPAQGVTDSGSGESFGAVVGRLLDGETPAVETPGPSKMASGTPVQVEKTMDPSGMDAEQQANALLLALGTPPWFVVPVVPPEAATPAEEVALENVDVTIPAQTADGPASTDVPMALVSAMLSAPVAQPVAATPDDTGAGVVTTVPGIEMTAGDAAVRDAAAVVAPGLTTTGSAPRAGIEGPAPSPLPVSTAPRGERTPLVDADTAGAPLAAGQAVDALEGAEAPTTAESAPALNATAPEIVVDAGTGAPDDVSRPSEPRAMKLSPQGARLAAALAHGDRAGVVAQIATAAATADVGRIVVEATRGDVTAAGQVTAASRSLDVALPEQVAPQAVRESATRFINFDTTVAALAAEAFQVRSPSESEFGASDDASAWARKSGAYDLRSAAYAAAFPDLHGRSPAVVDSRGVFSVASPTGVVSESVIPTGSLPAGTHAEMGDVPTQIVRAMHMQWRGGTGEAKLTLTPESLGEVTISMKVERGVVTATVKAENPVTMEWIRSHQHELRDALSAQGLKLDRFEVSVDPDGRRHRDEATQQQAARKPRPLANANTPRFELLV